MEFYAVAVGNITPADRESFSKIEAVLQRMPDIVFDPDDARSGSSKNQVSCHLLCRAIAKYFDVSVHDGHFYTNYEHSWLLSRGGTSIIDAYPIAGATPIIVARGGGSPWHWLYKESKDPNPVFETKEFARRLKRTITVVRETMDELGFV